MWLEEPPSIPLFNYQNYVSFGERIACVVCSLWILIILKDVFSGILWSLKMRFLEFKCFNLNMSIDQCWFIFVTSVYKGVCNCQLKTRRTNMTSVLKKCKGHFYLKVPGENTILWLSVKDLSKWWKFEKKF